MGLVLMLGCTAWNIQIEVPYIRQQIFFFFFQFIYLFLVDWRQVSDNTDFLW